MNKKKVPLIKNISALTLGWTNAALLFAFFVPSARDSALTTGVTGIFFGVILAGINFITAWRKKKVENSY